MSKRWYIFVALLVPLLVIWQYLPPSDPVAADLWRLAPVLKESLGEVPQLKADLDAQMKAAKSEADVLTAQQQFAERIRRRTDRLKAFQPQTDEVRGHFIRLVATMDEAAAVNKQAAVLAQELVHGKQDEAAVREGLTQIKYRAAEVRKRMEAELAALKRLAQDKHVRF
ncbi:hypothetical protein [Leeia sp.]|uniref:hypothetical protein n=1 Tax=Leeia sp. TaxID=2884678 RepID=UPI0035B157F3